VERNFETWSGHRPIGRLERLAYERHVHDLETAAERGLWYDREAADFYSRIFEDYLVLTEGEWAGRSFVLQPWQRFCVRQLFGWMTLPAGMTAADAEALADARSARGRITQRLRAGIVRRYRRALIEVAKKNGKSPFAAALAIIGLAFDGEPGAQVFSAATKRDQAGIVFRHATMMVKRSPELRKRLRAFRKSITYGSMDGFLQPITSDADTEDGSNLHFGILDELHRHKNRDLVDLFLNSGASRRQPLVVAITTAGDGTETVWREWREYGESVVEGVVPGDGYFVFIAAADPEDDWTAEDTWRKANPNYGITVKEANMRELCESAKASPGQRANFQRLRLNRPTSLTKRWIDMDQWRACGEIGDVDLTGRRCWLGVDLSKTIDLTAVVALFPPAGEDPNWRVRCWPFAPAGRIPERSRTDRVPYDVWARAGYLTATPGDVVDYAYVDKRVKTCIDEYNVEEICFDPWNSTKWYTDLQADGIENLVEVRQGHKTLSPAVKELERIIAQGQLAHGNHPVLSWCASNLVMRADANENLAPDKLRSMERIDCMVALIMAMTRAAHSLKSRRSVYEDRGLLSA
jgi:phage terminase large subunit-like protein